MSAEAGEMHHLLHNPDNHILPSQSNVIVYDAQLSHPEYTSNAPVTFRSSPLSILRHDLGLILRHAPEIPNIFLPLPGRSSTQKDVKFRGILLQVVYITISLFFTGLIVSSFTVGLPAPIIAIVATVLVIYPMNFVQGKPTYVMGGEKDHYQDEAWIFVNGVGTSYSGLQLILDHLHSLFHRQIIGIHNKTLGAWWDLVQCMIQRDFMWGTEDVRLGYEIICKHIADKSKTKVVIMGHSQGGIILSTWVDQLLGDFSAEDLSKVEIYTFAAAANHFSVPSTTIPSPTNIMSKTEAKAQGHWTSHFAEPQGEEGDRRQVFSIVEHFANERDYVSLIGLLEFAPPPPCNTTVGVMPTEASEGRFAGRIFKRLGHTGHLLLTHYLKIGDSILDDPAVRKYSQLVQYLGGRKAKVQQRVWKSTEL